MKRKIVGLGHNACVLTLPARWLKSNSLKKGDELNVEENGKQLIVLPGQIRR